MIHPTAIIHPKAKVHPTANIGPYAVVDERVEVGAGCVVGPHVYLTGIVAMGANNYFHAGCVIGDAPQDLKYKGEPTGLRIGDRNVFREHVTVQRSSKPKEDTVIGSDNFLMVNCHVAHNCQVGNHTIIANGALLGGYVQVGDRAFISGNCLVHQFARVGALSLMRGGSGISKDLPPYTIARGENGICGLNVIGLRRAGVTAEERLELKRLYRLLFRSAQSPRLVATLHAQKEFKGQTARNLLDFVSSAKKGLCRDFGASSEEADEADESD